MTQADLNQLRFPVGDFEKPETISVKNRVEWTQQLIQFPEEIKELTHQLNSQELNWKYRPEGWTIKQVVHHCADSHMNSFIRFKWTLTENKPIIKAYFEDRWSELEDGVSEDLQYSLLLLKGLHSKWVMLLNSLSEDQWKQSFIHPESGEEVLLEENLGIYAWHCKHHLAHIKQAIKFKGAFN